MFTQLKKVPALLFALVALVAVSCNTNDGPVDPGSKPGTPTALKAQSRSATSVGLKWDAPASGVTPSGYRVYYNVKGSATKVAVPDIAGASSTSEVVTGLTANTMYEFTVQALNGSVVGDATAALTWAPAYRTSVTTPIKIYSSLSALGSGLVVFNGTPRPETINNGNLWDLAYDDKLDAARPSIASPGFAYGYVNPDGTFKGSGLVSKITYLGRQYTNVNNLDEIFETESLNDAKLANDKEAKFDLSSPAGTGGIAFVFANKNASVSPNLYTYGKILVLRTGGTLVQGSDPNKYIEVVVSYQTTADVPYAVKAKIDEAERQAAVRQANAR